MNKIEYILTIIAFILALIGSITLTNITFNYVYSFFVDSTESDDYTDIVSYVVSDDTVQIQKQNYGLIAKCPSIFKITHYKLSGGDSTEMLHY